MIIIFKNNVWNFLNYVFFKVFKKKKTKKMSSEIFSVNGKSISIHAICTPIGQTKPYTYYGAFFTATFNFLAKIIFMLLGYYKNILCKISNDFKKL